ncbi:MAG: polyprenyl synthetase family protein [Bacteroidaceae bacterium]|nr:polyprenyl synthetase family protein [Bacteroidaceae bacterium]
MDFLKYINQALDSQCYPALPQGLYEPIRYTLEGGGKRIRPVLLLTTAYAYGATPEQALPAAIAIETYHNHTLLHDDLMDQAALRRGRATVWTKWDANTAVLSGDTMLLRAMATLGQCQCERWDELYELFVSTFIGVCEGQQMDMNFEQIQADEVNISEYIEMIRLKTSILVACAAKAGAIIANAETEDCNLLYAFAEKVGLAFQLQDDMLDVWGDPAIFGKANGGDIACGKKTYPLLTAFSLADSETRKELLKLINDKEASEAERIKRVTEIYNSMQVRKACEEAVEAYYDEATALYNLLPLSEEKKLPIWQWAEALLGRQK